MHKILRITHTVMIDRHSHVPEKVGIYQKQYSQKKQWNRWGLKDNHTNDSLFVRSIYICTYIIHHVSF